MASKQLDRIEGKVDVIDNRLDKIDVTLAKQQVSLDEHIKRTNALEARVVPLEKTNSIAKAVVLISGALIAISTLAYNIVSLIQHK